MISIVIPVYQSADCLPVLIERISATLEGSEFEVILVDDASKDNSWEVIEGLWKDGFNIKAFRLCKNLGQHAALMFGLRECRGSVTVFMDDDLQHRPENIPDLVSALEGNFDVCYANFEVKRHSAWKNFGSKCHSLLARLVLKKPKAIYLSPFKAINSSVREAIVQHNVADVFIDGKILAVTDRITSVTVPHMDRFIGTGNYTFSKSVGLTLQMLIAHSTILLRLIILLGMCMSLFAGVAGVYYVVSSVGFGADRPSGWTTLVCVSLFLGGTQLLALGVVAEYVGRIFVAQQSINSIAVRAKLG